MPTGTGVWDTLKRERREVSTGWSVTSAAVMVRGREDYFVINKLSLLIYLANSIGYQSGGGKTTAGVLVQA